MGYEHAPATQMLATDCIMCGRPLVDAVSIEAGIGPVCRQKHGYSSGVTEEHRCEANKLIHAIASDRRAKSVVSWIGAIENMGMRELAFALRVAVADFTVSEFDGKLILKAPRMESIFRVPGRTWDPEQKVSTFPLTSRVQLFYALREELPNGIGFGKKGLFWMDKF